jgi:hypothetical protein
MANYGLCIPIVFFDLFFLEESGQGVGDVMMTSSS